MKKAFEIIGIVILICFSFFYTDKVITVINEQDPIMVKIESTKEDYYIEPIDATINDMTIIPGINGRKVDVDKSYTNMRELGVFNSNNFKYLAISPNISLKDNNDKFIIKGNPNKQMVTIIFSLTSINNLEKITNILNSNNVTASFFIDYKILIKNINYLRKILFNYEIYSLGDNLEYSPDIILFSNNLIKRTFNNEPIYCLTTNYNKSTLNACSSNNLYTINVLLNSYNNLKTNLESGLIIYLDTTSKTLTDLDNIIKFLKSKGLDVTSLRNLLTE